MGLLKAAAQAFNSTMADQWKEYFYCDSLDADVLMIKGRKKVNGRSSNKGDNNIITNGSVIAVADGQCMIIVDQGKVAEVCAEPGEFIYDTSSEPSIFTGDLKDSILESFKTMGRRFTFGGDTGKDQRVYYVNTKEIMDNKFGTATPIPFRIVDARLNFDYDCSLRCNGLYSYRIVDPVIFYTNIAGNVSGVYTRDMLDTQLKAEFISGLQPSVAKISEMEIRPNALPAHVEELCTIMNSTLTQKWSKARGIEVASIAINSITLPEEDQQALKKYQQAAVLTNPAMMAATLGQAKADAMTAAANNSAGAMTGFMGFNMASAQGGSDDLQSMLNMGQAVGVGETKPQTSINPKMEPAGWTCSCGKTGNTGKFCEECGSPKPVENAGWTCAKCGTVNKGKFCAECGAPKPVAVPTYKCNKCGWTPEDPQNPPKFCPECGDPFNEEDIQ